MANYSMVEIEGVGDEYAAKLNAADIQTTDDLLRRCADKAGRDGVSTETGISDKHLLTWVNHCDLMRIDGVGPETAQLFEDCGVDSVPELAQRNAENLADKLKEENDKRKRTDRVPSAETLQGWIDAAGKMDKVVAH